MKIDRQRFLLLTATMAACTTGSQQQTGAIQVADPSEANTDASDTTVAVVLETEVDETKAPPNALPSRDVLRDACGQLAAPPSSVCESLGDVRFQCAKLAYRLPHESAAAVVGCLVARSGQSSVCGSSTSECFKEVISKQSLHAVDDKDHPQAAKRLRLCEEVAQHCKSRRWRSKGFDVAMCRKSLQFVGEKQTDYLLTCVRENCGVNYCSYSLRDVGF